MTFELPKILSITLFLSNTCRWFSYLNPCKGWDDISGSYVSWENFLNFYFQVCSWELFEQLHVIFLEFREWSAIFISIRWYSDSSTCDIFDSSYPRYRCENSQSALWSRKPVDFQSVHKSWLRKSVLLLMFV